MNTIHNWKVLTILFEKIQRTSICFGYKKMMKSNTVSARLSPGISIKYGRNDSIFSTFPKRKGKLHQERKKADVVTVSVYGMFVHLQQPNVTVYTYTEMSIHYSQA